MVRERENNIKTTSVTYQIACEIIENDPKLQDGFNAIGFSQGSQFLLVLKSLYY